MITSQMIETYSTTNRKSVFLDVILDKQGERAGRVDKEVKSSWKCEKRFKLQQLNADKLIC